MEEGTKNDSRLEEIEKELADLDEKRTSLQSQFDNEKEVFNQIAEVKATIEALKSKAEQVKREGDFNKAAEIEYGQIPAEQEKLKAWKINGFK